MAGDGWTTKRLGEVANINPDAIGRDWPHSHIRYIDISSVGVGQIEVAPQWMKLSDAPSRAKRLLRKGDTILSTVRPNRRSMFFASEPNDDWVVSTGFAVLRPNIKLVEPRFLYTCVFNQAFTEYLITREKGAAYPAVSSEDIASAEIPFPPLAEQHAIAHILGTLDDKIELNRRMNRTLEEMARAIFRSWFVDFDPVRAKMEGRWKKGESLPGLPADLWDTFPDKLVDSELGPIPEGWEARSVGSLADVRGGKQLHRDRISQTGPIPVFGGAGIMGYTTEHNATGFVITVGRVGAYCGQFFAHRGNAWVNNNASLIDPKDRTYGEWLYLSLCHANIDVLKKGAAQPFVSNGDIGEMQLTWPGEGIIRQFTRLLEALNKAGRMRKFLLVVPKWADDSPAIGRPSGKIHTGSPSGMLL